MKTIASFTIDHIRLLPGLYVSRKDEVGGNRLTTFDVRLTAPNREPVLSTGAIHAIEHIGATYLRCDSGLASQTIYWGPMGCPTGFYAIFSGDLTPQDIVDEMIHLFQAVCDHTGPIPGATQEGCGNYSDMDLPAAQEISRKYLEILTHLDTAHSSYPA